MKHSKKIIILLLLMFVVAQLIGIYVVNHYISPENVLPFGLDTPTPETNSEYGGLFIQIVIAFILAIFILFLFLKFKVELILRLWFLTVIIISLGIAFTAIFPEFRYKFYVVLAVSAIFGLVKIFQRNFIVHNFTELLIYPGIAAVFVPLLNVWTIILLLILISIYDMWAVWHSGIMQKMAKYQMENLKVFSGFFVPYMSKAARKKVKLWKNTLKKSELRKKKIKVNVAILGGGDIVFPIITSGVMLKTLGLGSALFVVLGATLGLGYLFLKSEKKKFYPAMPYITTGILLGIGLSYLVF